MNIHVTHHMVAVPVNNAEECAACWQCTCHDGSGLSDPCPDA
jgi:hypothetical protein